MQTGVRDHFPVDRHRGKGFILVLYPGSQAYCTRLFVSILAPSGIWHPSLSEPSQPISIHLPLAGCGGAKQNDVDDVDEGFPKSAGLGVVVFVIDTFSMGRDVVSGLLWSGSLGGSLSPKSFSIASDSSSSLKQPGLAVHSPVDRHRGNGKLTLYPSSQV